MRFVEFVVLLLLPVSASAHLDFAQGVLGQKPAVCVDGAPCSLSTRVWQTVEITLRAKKAAVDPLESDVWVDLSGPGFSKRVFGFWDGGNTYRVRVIATAPGSWTWLSGSLSNDPGLSGKKGAIQASAWTEAEKEDNPNRRGQVRIASSERHFEYADGAPLFLLADTIWAANTARCGLGKNQDGPFFEYLADRKAKGFTAVLLQTIHGYGDYPGAQAHRNEGGYAFEGGNPARLNTAYFQALDKRMDALWEHGFVVATPFMWWGKTGKCLFTPGNALRIIRYAAARYGTFNLLWSLSGEYQYTFRDCGWTPDDITTLGRALQERNPWQRPVSIHPSGGTQWQAPHGRQSSIAFHGQSWLDHHWLQTGQDRTQMHNIVGRTAENRALQPAMPVFCSESSYERASDPDAAYHARWQAWTAFLNGAAGYGYGAHGVWQFLDPSDPMGEPGKMTRHPPVPWREAIRFPGSAQLVHVRKLLPSLGWPQLSPRREALRVNGQPNRPPSPQTLTPPEAALAGGKVWVVYLPRGNAKSEITIPVAPAHSGPARWFDPRKGEFHGPAVLWRGGKAPLPARPAPQDEDWVFVAGGATPPHLQ